MAIDFTSATGNLFNRLGKIFAAIQDLEVFQTTTVPGFVDGVSDQFNDDRFIVDGLNNGGASAISGVSGAKSVLTSEAEATVIEMVDDDKPLTSKSIELALTELIGQMVTGSESVDASAPGISVAADAGNTGDGTVLVSIVDGKGVSLESVLAEVLTIECTSDSQPSTGGTAINGEQFSAQGEEVEALTSNLWPRGSGGNTTLPVVNAEEDASVTNLLANSDFEVFAVTDIPDDWTISVGTASTSVLESADEFYGTSALQFVGQSSPELTKLTQTLRLLLGDGGQVQPETRYAIGAWVKVSSVPVGGVLAIALRDGISGSVVGGASIAVTLSGEATVYAFKSVQIATPKVLPDNLYLVIELTTAIDDTVSVLIDQLVMTEMVQHENGPLMAIFPGATKFIVGDKFNVTVTNDRTGSFQEFFHRTFDMAALGLQLPSNGAGSETILDSLIS